MRTEAEIFGFAVKYPCSMLPSSDSENDTATDFKLCCGILLATGGARIVKAKRASPPQGVAADLTFETSEFRPMPDRLMHHERAALEAEAARLREEHRDLDAAIDALELVGKNDQLQIQRLKKRKLFLRDRLAFLDDTLTPDIIA